jgi:F-type H+-transporting ATPase subunit b
LEKLGLNLGYLFVQIFNFGILFVVLRAWVYKPILGLLDKRRMAIAQGLEDARVAAEARAMLKRKPGTYLLKPKQTPPIESAKRLRELTQQVEKLWLRQRQTRPKRAKRQLQKQLKNASGF